MGKIIANYNLTIPQLIGGLNKDTSEMITFFGNSGYTKIDDKSFPQLDARNGPTTISPGDWYIDLDAVFLWCDLGAEIEGYHGAFHELADPLKICPYDPQGLQNWMEFGVIGQSHIPVEIGDFWYRSMNMGVPGIPLPCSSWYDYTRQPNTNLTGIQRIISLFEFQEIEAANGP